MKTPLSVLRKIREARELAYKQYNINAHITFNIQGTYDIGIDEPIYYKEQEKMVEKIKEIMQPYKLNELYVVTSEKNQRYRQNNGTSWDRRHGESIEAHKHRIERYRHNPSLLFLYNPKRRITGEEEFEFEIGEIYKSEPKMAQGVKKAIYLCLLREGVISKKDQIVIPVGGDDFDFTEGREYWNANFEVFKDPNIIRLTGSVAGNISIQDNEIYLSSITIWNLEESEDMKHNPARKYAGEGSEVQSLLFDRDLWTVQQAKNWLKEQGFRYGDTDIPPTGNYIHFRQFPPTKGTMTRTIPFGDPEETGIQARIEIYHPRKNPRHREKVYENFNIAEFIDYIDEENNLGLSPIEKSKLYDYATDPRFSDKLYANTFETIIKLWSKGKWHKDWEPNMANEKSLRSPLRRNPNLLFLYNKRRGNPGGYNIYRSRSLPFYGEGYVSFFDQEGKEHKVYTKDFEDITTEGGRFHQFYTYRVKEREHPRPRYRKGYTINPSERIPVLLEVEIDWSGVKRGGYLTVGDGPRQYVYDYQLGSVERDYSKSPYKLTIRKIKK